MQLIPESVRQRMDDMRRKDGKRDMVLVENILDAELAAERVAAKRESSLSQLVR
jgi:hypothetical protein